MPRVRVSQIRTEFEERVDAARNVVGRIGDYSVLTDGRLRPLSPPERSYIAEMAFLRVLLAWEDFLEESFIRYMIGATPRRGRWPRPESRPKTLDRARTIMLGERRDYVDWYSPDAVNKRAELHFSRPELYVNAINAVATHLNRMRIIRNRIAHRSQRAKKRYEGLLRTFYGAVIGGRGPGDVLLAPPANAALPPGGGAGAASLMELYSSILKAAARQIVP